MHKFKKLKEMVLQSQDLREPLNYFFDLMEGDKILNTEAYSIIDKIDNHSELLAIMSVLQTEISQRLGFKALGLIPMLYEIPEYHFIHGVCSFQNVFRPITFIYFTDCSLLIIQKSS